MRIRRGATAVVAVLALVAVGAATDARGVDAGSWTSANVRLTATPGATIVVDGVGEFRGTIELRRSGSGVAVINELPLEEYLLGLAEVPSTWPPAALEAQAIAARTFALYSQLVRSSATHRRAGADICATQACQVYQGVERERRDSGGAWAAAVRRSAHRYVLYRGGPILAKYASSNGGHSDAGGAPYLPAVADPDDAAASPWVRWTSVLPLDAVARALPGPGQLVEVVRTGDVFVLRRQQADGSIVEEGVAPADVRRRFNAGIAAPAGLPVPVPSVRFTASTEGPHAVLSGAGFGHLVGMSQYGALGKARRGMSADDILASYYAGLRPQAVPADRLPAHIRVAVALDVGRVRLHPANGRLSIVDAAGHPIALLSSSTWTATPAGVAVQLGGDHPALTLEATRVAAGAARLRLSAPARVLVHDPHPRDLGILDAGTHLVPVADAVGARVDADAGGGRTASAEVAPAFHATAATDAPAQARARLRRATAASRSTPSTAAPSLLAGLLAVTIGTQSGRRLRSRRAAA